MQIHDNAQGNLLTRFWRWLLWQPHTVTVLMITGVLLYILEQNNKLNLSETDLIERRKHNLVGGIIFVHISFFIYSSLMLPDGVYVKPHPIFWRFAQSTAVVYLLWLIFLFFQDLNDAKKILFYFDTQMGGPLTERIYAEHCGLTGDSHLGLSASFYDSVFDRFVLAHAGGWFAKALIFRDYSLCWIASILWEYLEYILIPILPNFAECWWDRVFLDIFGANMLGIFLGMQVVSWCSQKTATRRRTSTQRSQSGPFVTWAEMFGEFSWHYLDHPQKLFGAIWLVILVQCVDLSAFFIKNILAIPDAHPFNLIRMLIWAAIALPGAQEYYCYMSGPEQTSFGPMTWLCTAIAGMEILFIVNFAPSVYDTSDFPLPPNFGLHVGFAGLVLAIMFSFSFWKAFVVNRPHRAFAHHRCGSNAQKKTKFAKN